MTTRALQLRICGFNS